MKTLQPFIILIASAFLASAQAETPPVGNLKVGTKIPTLQLQNGRSFTGVTVTKIDDEGVSIQHEGGLARIKFVQFPAEFLGAANDLGKSVEAPPARFSADALSFFAAVSSQYWFNGDPVKSLADPKPALTRLAGTSDPLLKEAVDVALALDANQKDQEALGRLLEAKMTGMVPDVQAGILSRGAKAAATAQFRVVGTDGNGQPITQEIPQSLDGIAQGLEADMGGANMQAALGRMSELGIRCQELSRELRMKVAAIAKRDLPKALVLSSPVIVEFVAPGMLCVTNQSGKTLNNCQFSTATTMSIPHDGIDHQAIANLLTPLVGYSTEFSQEAAKRGALSARLAAAERGFVVFVPKLRDQETVTIPFCDMPSLPAAGAVRLSLWTDEFTGENAPVAGLQELKGQLEAEAKARWERQNANAQRAKKPALNDGQRVNLQPKISRDPNNPLHQGNGARMFNR